MLKIETICACLYFSNEIDLDIGIENELNQKTKAVMRTNKLFIALNCSIISVYTYLSIKIKSEPYNFFFKLNYF